jgi:hypothetical protein
LPRKKMITNRSKSYQCLNPHEEFSIMNLEDLPQILKVNYTS